MKFSQYAGRALLLGAALVFAGCSNQDRSVSPKAKSDTKAAKAEHKHEGWWCQEHGVPEEICSLCSAEAAAKFKKAGDWCEIHDRAKSQCFKCDPSLYKNFEARYVAKYGNKPEPPSKEEFEK